MTGGHRQSARDAFFTWRKTAVTDEVAPPPVGPKSCGRSADNSFRSLRGHDRTWDASLYKSRRSEPDHCALTLDNRVHRQRLSQILLASSSQSLAVGHGWLASIRYALSRFKNGASLQATLRAIEVIVAFDGFLVLAQAPEEKKQALGKPPSAIKFCDATSQADF